MVCGMNRFAPAWLPQTSLRSQGFRSHWLPQLLALLAALALLAVGGCSDDSLVVGSLTTPDVLLDTLKGELDGADTAIADDDTSEQDGDDGEPGDSEPLDVAPPDTEPADTDPADVEPTDTDAADVEPADTEPGDTGPLDGTPADSDAVDDADPVTPTCPPCPVGYVCRLEGGPPRCVADPALACTPCASALSCAGGLCLGLGGDPKACILPCPDPGGGCAKGQSCKLVEGLELCIPDTNSCTCSTATAGATQVCVAGGGNVGVCTGQRVCEPDKGGWSACTAVGASAETCNGLDDDCDGSTDEGLASTPCGGTDSLCPGLASCAGAAGWICDAKAKLPEQCNGADDDCDGATDEDLVGVACGDDATLCPGVTTCQGAAGWLCSAAQKTTETCNGVDDDCDGSTDEGFTNADGKPQSLLHCGACGVACPVPASLGTAVTCTVADAGPSAGSPACAWSCLAGWYDADGIAGTGCECKAQPGADLPDGVDQDCDGVDGVAALAVFVAKTGSDQNPGTRALPMRTVDAALNRAVATGKPHLYVATGVYAETVQLVPGVSIYGGYASGFGVRDPIAYQTVVSGPTVSGGVQATVICDGISGGAAAVPTRVDGLTILGAAALGAGAPSYGVWSIGCDDRFALVGCQVLAGSGGAGSSGASGAGGSSGAKGSVGLPARDIGKALCGPDDAQPGGAGGVGLCPSGANAGIEPAGWSTAGGAGGSAICPVMDEDAPSPACPSKPYTQTAKAEETGAPGALTASKGAGTPGAGGKPGWDSYIDSWQGKVTACVNGPGCGTCRVPVEQRDGDDGADGGNGSNGLGGQACHGPKGVASATAWLPNAGLPGGNGGNGGGGGGGGAAGGVEVHDCANSTSKFPDTGGSGGGGGAGGCGGLGGLGGGGGGASVAVGIVVGSGGAPVLIGNLLTGGNGGHGGSGGPGGGGGIGGKGGKGGAAVENKSETFCTSSGGDGGDGGDGGAGGGGGGGCGGPSAAILLLPGAGTQTSTVDPTKLTALNQLVVGKPGAGGNGGPSVGGAGAKGLDGVATAILQP